MNELGLLGTTASAQRYWCHKSYKANTPLRLLLAILQTLTLHMPIYDWVAIHRVHHKFTDTEKDPHNAKNGFWFPQVLWLLYVDIKQVRENAHKIGMADMENDKIVQFQRK